VTSAPNASNVNQYFNNYGQLIVKGKYSHVIFIGWHLINHAALDECKVPQNKLTVIGVLLFGRADQGAI